MAVKAINFGQGIAAYNASGVTFTDGEIGGLQVTQAGLLKVSIDADTVGIGGGVTYTEGDVDTTITGTAIMWEDASDTLRAVSAAKPLPVDIKNTSIAVTDNGGSLTVDGTVSISGTVTVGTHAVTQSGTWNIGTVTTVSTLTNITNWGNVVDNAAFTDGTTRLLMGGYIFDEVAGTALTENDAAAARIDSKRAQVFVLEDATTRGLRANVKDLTNADALVVAIVDGSGNQITSFGGGVEYAEDAAHSSGDTGKLVLAVRSDAGGTLVSTDGDYTPLSIDANGALRVTGGGGGTEYTEDAATPADPVGGATMLRRRDTLSGTEVSADGDWIQANATSKGELYVKHTDAIPVTDNGGALTVDGTVAISGTVTVATHAVTQSGTWDIGTVTTVTAVTSITNAVKVIGNVAHDAAYAGDPVLLGAYASSATPTAVSANGDVVRIWADLNGRVAVWDGNTTISIDDGAGSITIDGSVSITGSVTVVGDVAHDAADSGNPQKIGGRAQEPTASLEEVSADNDRVDAAFDRQGRLATWMGYPVTSAVINHSTSGDNTIVAAQGAGKRIAVIGCVIVSDGTTDVRWEDGASGTAKTGQIPLQAREGFVMPIGPHPWFVGTANTLLNLELTAAVNVHGIVSYVVMED